MANEAQQSGELHVSRVSRTMVPERFVSASPVASENASRRQGATDRIPVFSSRPSSRGPVGCPR